MIVISRQLILSALLQIQRISVKVKKQVVLFPEIGRMKNVLSLTRSHSRMRIRICISNFKNNKQTNKETNKYKQD